MFYVITPTICMNINLPPPQKNLQMNTTKHVSRSTGLERVGQGYSIMGFKAVLLVE